jgi:hypothetical protein
MQYATVTNATGKVVALFVHDPNVGRIVYKGPPGSDIAASFDVVASKPVVRTKLVDGAMLRRKVLPTDPKFLAEKLNDMIFPPYKIQQLSDTTESSMLDDVADRLEKEWFPQ